MNFLSTVQSNFDEELNVSDYFTHLERNTDAVEIVFLNVIAPSRCQFSHSSDLVNKIDGCYQY